jgi:hypothetical protein
MYHSKYYPKHLADEFVMNNELVRWLFFLYHKAALNTQVFETITAIRLTSP